jgi:hypothetical protein
VEDDKTKEAARARIEELRKVVLAQALDVEDPAPREYAQLCALQLLALSASELPAALRMIAVGGMFDFVAGMADKLRKGGADE